MAIMKPKLALRDLFWLMLVIAMGFGWVADRGRYAFEYDLLANKYGRLLQIEAVAESLARQAGYELVDGDEGIDLVPVKPQRSNEL
jgi:hypothetical protein